MLSKSEHYIDDVAVAARAYVLAGRDAPINSVIYAHANAGTTHSSGAAGGVAPHDAAISSNIKVVVESVGTAVHNTLRMAAAALTEGNGVPDSTRAVHVNVAGAIQRSVAEHIIISEVHSSNVKDTCMPRLSFQHKR